jgi:CDGSH-type Zn-finger protein
MQEEKDKESVRVYTKPNGPIIISGDFELENEDGQISKEKRIAFCRCAHSGKMPICDGSHNRVGFQSL